MKMEIEIIFMDAATPKKSCVTMYTQKDKCCAYVRGSLSINTRFTIFFLFAISTGAILEAESISKKMD